MIYIRKLATKFGESQREIKRIIKNRLIPKSKNYSHSLALPNQEMFEHLKPQKYELRDYQKEAVKAGLESMNGTQ